MSGSSADRNLLFGILALQNNFINREALLSAFNVWIADKSRDLGELLRDQKQLRPNQLALLTGLVDELIQQVGSPEKCLENLSSIESARQELQALHDPDLQASLRHVSRRKVSEEDRGAQTLDTKTVGASSFTGARFRILRFHAKGGLGEVFVAKDEELNREVAYKQIQPAHADDLDSRSRFLREAEITGGLEHPSIVPVYGLGQYADGRPFYAMRFIRGDSLQDAIAAFHAPRSSALRSEVVSSPARNLALRKLLQRFIDVCEAIEYAHSRGVLHRDLKPGNIMLGKYGETLVVDWGLARASTGDPASSNRTLGEEPTLQPRSGGDSSATEMGIAIGTPAYMPPEQASGRLDLLGPPSDVYSLGATLYCLLTGKPPVMGANTQEIIVNVIAARIPSPRSHDRTIPLALEAICLKALSREPGDRYATARALKDDIENYLADERVSAYPEPLAVRARRWVRRHQTAAVATSLSVLLSAAFLGVLLLVSASANQRLEAANKELKETNDKLDMANNNLAASNTKLKETNEELDTANSNLTAANVKLEAAVSLAQEQNKLALETLNYVVFQVDKDLGKVPGAGEVRQTLLNGVLERLKQVSDQYQSRAAIDRDSMATLISIADLVLRIGSAEGASAGGAVSAARELYRSAHEIGERLAQADPSNAEAQRDLSISHDKLANIAWQSGDLASAHASYEKALTIAIRLAELYPSNAQAQRDLSLSYDNEGNVVRQSGDLVSARASYQKSLAIRVRLVELDPSSAQAQRDLSMSHDYLGDTAWQSGDLESARAPYEKALAIRVRLAQSDPSDARLQRDLSISYEKLGDIAARSGDLESARRSHENTLAIAARLAELDPSDAQAQRDLSISYNKLGGIAVQSGDLELARASFEKAQAIRALLAASDPSNAQAQRDLWVSYNKLGDIDMQSGDVESARASYQKALAIAVRLAELDPSNAQAQRDLSASYERLGDIAIQSGDVELARASYQKALVIFERLAESDPSNAQAQRDLSVSYIKLGDIAMQSGGLVSARTSYEKALAIAVRLAESDPSDVQAQRDWMVTCAKLGLVGKTEKKWKIAIESFEQGERILENFRERSKLDVFNEELKTLRDEIEVCRKELAAEEKPK